MIAAGGSKNMPKVTTPEVALDSSADLANYISFEMACYMIETKSSRAIYQRGSVEANSVKESAS